VGPVAEAAAAVRDLDRAALVAGLVGPAAAVAQAGVVERIAAEACGRRGKPLAAEAGREAASDRVAVVARAVPVLDLAAGPVVGAEAQASAEVEAQASAEGELEAEAGLVRVAAAEARVQGPAELAAGEPAVAEARVAEAAEEEQELVVLVVAEARVQELVDLAAVEPAVALVRVAEPAEEEQDLAGPAVAEEWADRAEEAAPAVDLASADLVVVEERNRENG
jgi:hypothetical protein